MKFIPVLALSAALMTTTAMAQQSDSTVPADPPAATESAPPTTPAPQAEPTLPDSSTTTSPSAADTTADASMGPMMTDSEAKAWINKVVYSSDGTNLGEVANILRDNSGHVTELHADIGGFLGLGETRVRVAPSDFKLDKDRVILNIPADQAKTLPKIEK
ncbi:MAG: PRC-barrel domain-containing protein [Hyphomicrobium sp.]|jgi:sporulation protein YlmC with PRC-barrel domain|nr:PRC-barrel domain-containing protein [Hyphomicrobium sp.]